MFECASLDILYSQLVHGYVLQFAKEEFCQLLPAYRMI